MSNPLRTAKSLMLGVRAAIQFVRHPKVLGEISAARDDRESIDLNEAIAKAHRSISSSSGSRDRYVSKEADHGR